MKIGRQWHKKFEVGMLSLFQLKTFKIFKNSSRIQQHDNCLIKIILCRGGSFCRTFERAPKQSLRLLPIRSSTAICFLPDFLGVSLFS